MKPVLACLLLALTAPAGADRLYDQCMAKSDNTNVAWAECAASRAHREDARLNAAWRQALAKAGGAQAPTGRALLAEQRAWLAYRAKACLYYDDAEQFGREGQVLSYPECVSEIVGVRTRFLTRFATDK